MAGPSISQLNVVRAHFSRIDTNRDGSLSSAEASSYAATYRAKQQELRTDGVITPGESLVLRNLMSVEYAVAATMRTQTDSSLSRADLEWQGFLANRTDRLERLSSAIAVDAARTGTPAATPDPALQKLQAEQNSTQEFYKLLRKIFSAR